MALRIPRAAWPQIGSPVPIEEVTIPYILAGFVRDLRTLRPSGASLQPEQFRQGCDDGGSACGLRENLFA
jgi:hypothetical protein